GLGVVGCRLSVTLATPFGRNTGLLRSGCCLKTDNRQPTTDNRQPLFRPLSFHPCLAVLENFFLPDRDSLFDAIDRIMACLKSDMPMWRGHYNHDGRFRNLQFSETMNDADALDFRPTLANLCPYAAHFFNGHRFIGFVRQGDDWAALGIIAHNAVKCDHCP